MTRVIDPYPIGDLFRGPSFGKAVSYILQNKIVLEPLVCIGLGLSFRGPSVCPAWRIASALRWRVSSKFPGDGALVSTKDLCNFTEAIAFREQMNDLLSLGLGQLLNSFGIVT